MIKPGGKIITVSADDFGISQLANTNILALAEAKKIDRVEIMVSKNLSPEYVSRLLSSGVKLDIHFHLAKDKLDFWQNNPRIIEKGAIKRISLFLYNFFFGHNRPAIVEREWERQILDFKELFGKFPDGASSHEHIHFFPPYFRRFLKLAKKYDINYIRFGKYPYRHKNKVCAILNFLKKMDFMQFKRSSVATSDYMVSFDWNHDLDACVKNAHDHSEIEVIFHPELAPEYEVLERL
jgi:predicted glycoside hydrolase/deacetylase ChbG (UPF0249 family)